jgi:hypothetical protein
MTDAELRDIINRATKGDPLLIRTEEELDRELRANPPQAVKSIFGSELHSSEKTYRSRSRIRARKKTIIGSKSRQLCYDLYR